MNIWDLLCGFYCVLYSKGFLSEGLLSEVLLSEVLLSEVPLYSIAVLYITDHTHSYTFFIEISDFHQLHEISYILEKANLSSVPAFKITGDYNPTTSLSQTPSLLELYNIRTRIDNDLVLGVLIEKGQFMAAREYAKVAQVSIAQVTIKEVSTCILISIVVTNCVRTIKGWST